MHRMCQVGILMVLPIEQALTKKALIAKMSVAEFRENVKNLH